MTSYPIHAQQQPIRVYVQSNAGGFTTAGAGDSATDLEKSLSTKEKTIRVVNSSSEADITVRVDSRSERKELDSVVTYKNKSDDGKHTTTTTVPNQDTKRIVHATLIAGDFSTGLEGEGITWRGAADKIATLTDRWIKENYPRILERRTEQKQVTQTEHTASSGATAPSNSDVSIEPGMTPSQVVKMMGEPLKKVAFGQKALWTYKGMQIVFTSDKVTDVKF